MFVYSMGARESSRASLTCLLVGWNSVMLAESGICMRKTWAINLLTGVGQMTFHYRSRSKGDNYLVVSVRPCICQGMYEYLRLKTWYFLRTGPWADIES